MRLPSPAHSQAGEEEGVSRGAAGCGDEPAASAMAASPAAGAHPWAAGAGAVCPRRPGLAGRRDHAMPFPASIPTERSIWPLSRESFHQPASEQNGGSTRVSSRWIATLREQVATSAHILRQGRAESLAPPVRWQGSALVAVRGRSSRFGHRQGHLLGVEIGGGPSGGVFAAVDVHYPASARPFVRHRCRNAPGRRS